MQEGSLFAAIVGTAVNGEDFITAAVKAGAVAVLCRPEAATLVPEGVAVVTHPEPRHALSVLARAFYQPQPRHIVAITGTDGKTSTAEFTRQWWELLGKPALSIGTLGLKSDRTLANLPTLSDNTTPEAVAFYQTLQKAAEQGVQHVACEASSHGIHQHRLDGIAPEVAVFTSFSQDHLDYHATMEAYFAAKVALFSHLLPADGTAVLCSDYVEIAGLAERLRDEGRKVVTYGTHGDLAIRAITPSAKGQAVEIAYQGQTHHFTVPIFGAFQVSNILAAALAVSVTTGVVLGDMLLHASRLTPIRGRLELVTTTREGALVFVDYAHTAGALEKALLTLKPYVKGRLHLVFGCGGDRDAGKRPKMGAVAARLADNVIVTDDNPRTENALAIRQAILAGCPDAAEVAGRAQAIALATRTLQAGDVLLIAGKGHEDYQIIGTTKHPFDDRTAVVEALRQEDA
jgi:UDP-N-acetylmuramoyl-L-alanyl-D-glutamate--2,6-diaminopimelate ligase